MHRVGITERIVNRAIKSIIRTACRVDTTQLERVPASGPLLLVTNHVNFLEVPLVYTHLQPRPLTGYAKAETWESGIMGRLFDLWGAIPIQRGEADMKALRTGIEVLAAGQILAVAPEGTRSGDGVLRQGQAGIVLLALKSEAPILPLACSGGELIWENLRRFRRTDFRIAVGRPFHLRQPSTPITRAMRQQMVDEIMYQLAALLPPNYRGLYADSHRSTEKFLLFD